MTTTRIYVIADTKLYDPAKPEPSMRLVRATHPSAALSHVARRQFKVHVATQNNIADLITAGVKVEDAS